VLKRVCSWGHALGLIGPEQVRHGGNARMLDESSRGGIAGSFGEHLRVRFLGERMDR